MNKETILSLLEQIKEAEKSSEGRLPQNSFYLDYDKVVCCKRENGESRYPYDSDGLMVWLHSTGFINAIESKFNIFRSAHFGEESPVNFFGGIKGTDGTFTPVSITGSSRPWKESGVSRYILYSLKCAYCITEVDGIVFTLRLHVDGKKHIHFSLSAINTCDDTKKIYIASFIEALLRDRECEFFWDKLRKYGKRYEDGSFILTSRNNGSFLDSAVITTKIFDGNVTARHSTCARNVFLGDNSLAIANALSLRRGYFTKEAYSVSTTDLPIASDIFHIEAKAGEMTRIEYDILICHYDDNENLAEKSLGTVIDCNQIDDELEALETREKNDFDNIKMRFVDWKTDEVDAETFNKFLRSVQKQVTICAHGKNYAGSYIGVRDVFQQIEGALIWQSPISREKILTALGCVLVTGRAPRQFSVPDDPTVDVPVILEKYIDQGVWIISTIYTYLSYTGDYSILNEICGYIEVDDDDDVYVSARRSAERDTVLEHLKRIMDYLFSAIDEEYDTGCLRVLFGDWNDSVDGLGETEDEGKKFGSGVTVMATLQFYQNLREMTEILSVVGDPDGLTEKYAKAAARIEAGLERYAIDVNDKGERRIIHGWGDKIGYKVGSFCDPDGAARYSLTSNSFWAITKFLNRDPSLKSSIMDCIDAVSSKYGLKTFDIPFPIDAKGVGRIVSLIPGTYENSCAYAHGSLFGTMALFEMGESRRAWEELLRTSVITHENCTMTTFAMPNSYCENADYGMDGESMGDWHTGSGTVLIKEAVRYGFGIYPTLGGIRIQTPAYFPAKHGEISLNVKGSNVTLIYDDNGTGKRSVDIKGADGIVKTYDELMAIDTYFIPADKMSKYVTITVND